MESYSKLIPIKFVVDDESADKAEFQIESLIKDIKISIGEFDKNSFASAKTKTETAVDNQAGAIDAPKETSADTSSFEELFAKQYESYKEIERLKSSVSEEDKAQLEIENQIYTNLVNQTKLLGADGQLSILDKKADLMADIEEYSRLDTKEAKEKVKVLKDQLKYINDSYKIESKSDVKKENRQSAMRGLQDIDRSLTGGAVGSTVGALNSFKTSFISGLAITGAAFIKTFGNLMKEGEEAAKELYQTSKVSNSETRETMFHWGVDKSSAQGINQANEIFDFGSDEDMFYGFSENPELQKKYYDTVSRFAERYSQLEEEGTFDKMLDYQIEMAELEFELQQEQAKFYMENIDEMKAIKKLTLDIQIMFAKIFGWLAKMFNNEYASTDATKAAEILKESSVVNNTNKSTSVSIDNSFNNQGATDKVGLESTLTSLLNVVEASLN